SKLLPIERTQKERRCDTEDSGALAGKSAKLVTACGAWAGGPGRTMKSLWPHCNMRLISAATSSTRHGHTAKVIAKDCWVNSFAPIRERNSTPRPRFRRRTGSGLAAEGLHWTK